MLFSQTKKQSLDIIKKAENKKKQRLKKQKSLSTKSSRINLEEQRSEESEKRCQERFSRLTEPFCKSQPLITIIPEEDNDFEIDQSREFSKTQNVLIFRENSNLGFEIPENNQENMSSSWLRDLNRGNLKSEHKRNSYVEIRKKPSTFYKQARSIQDGNKTSFHSRSEISSSSNKKQTNYSHTNFNQPNEDTFS